MDIKGLRRKLWRSPLARPIRIWNWHVWQSYKHKLFSSTRNAQQLTKKAEALRHKIASTRALIRSQLPELSAMVAEDAPQDKIRAAARQLLSRKIPAKFYPDFDRAFSKYDEARRPDISTTQANRLVRQADLLLGKAEKRSGFKIEHRFLYI